MPTRNINLTDHYDSFLADQLEAGRFQNASEVVRAGLRLLERQESEYEAKLQALREANAIGMRDYANGDYTVIRSKEDMDKVFSDIWAEIEE